MANDETLYQQIKAGDLSAFDLLYERYRLRLFRFIFSYLKNQQESEDLFQEAFMKVLKSNLDLSEGTFQAWIFETSRNLCLNQLRARNRADLAYQSMPEAQHTPNAESELSSQAVSEKIQTAVTKLPEAQAEVFNLKILGVSEKDIAKTLQIPLGTVKSRFHKIIELIRQEVNE